MKNVAVLSEDGAFQGSKLTKILHRNLWVIPKI